MKFLTKTRVLIWGEKSETKQEERLVRKIDFFLLTFCCLSYFVNYLDRAALTNAYVTGMKEDLHMFGKEFNIINSCFTSGYIVAQIPHAIALQRIKPRIWFPAMMLAWAALTIGTAGVKNYKQVCAIRFFQGVAEASTFSGTNWLLGSWYTKSEIGKRTGIFVTSGMAGTMFSGFIQTGIHSSMNGLQGLTGWRWVFIIDGVITIPIAIYGFFFFPDTPQTTRAPYFSQEERDLATARIPPKINNNTRLDFDLLKRVCGTWHLYMFTLLWVIGGACEATTNQGLFPQYLQGHKYSIAARNNYPTAITAVSIVSTWICAIQIDVNGVKWIWGFIIGICEIISGSLIWAYNIPQAAIFFAYYLAGVSYAGQVVYFAWANELLAGDDARRGIVLFSMNMFSSVLFAFWGILLYPATDSPRFRNGAITLIPISVTLMLLCVAVHLLQKRDERRGIVGGVNIADIDSRTHEEKKDAGSVDKQEEALSSPAIF